MKIVTLSENYAKDKGILAEHGLSLYLETFNSDGTINHRILFDTGQCDVFIKNAQKLGVDLSNVDSVVISHGHYDHAGGLNNFLKINKKAKIYMKMEALAPKFHKDKLFIGFEPDMSLMDGRVEFIDEVTNIGESAFIFPEILIFSEFDTSFMGRDKFDDELFLAVVENSSVTVLSSCSHRGISNIVKAAHEYLKLPIKNIIGGFHTRDVSEDRINFIAHNLKQYSPESIGICHCTGFENLSQFRELLPETSVFYNNSGNKIFLN
ncbi:MAG: MBL fold hydrolase [Bacteroidetes bacterium HGW-Bacteroidetes-10]|nr:MAG: MBL fold hydrolase [Bacteroidetes bacterium HGW-Bacteroidetes-10]